VVGFHIIPMDKFEYEEFEIQSPSAPSNWGHVKMFKNNFVPFFVTILLEFSQKLIRVWGVRKSFFEIRLPFTPQREGVKMFQRKAFLNCFENSPIN